MKRKNPGRARYERERQTVIEFALPPSLPVRQLDELVAAKGLGMLRSCG